MIKGQHSQNLSLQLLFSNLTLSPISSKQSDSSSLFAVTHIQVSLASLPLTSTERSHSFRSYYGIVTGSETKAGHIQYTANHLNMLLQTAWLQDSKIQDPFISFNRLILNVGFYFILCNLNIIYKCVCWGGVGNACVCVCVCAQVCACTCACVHACVCVHTPHSSCYIFSLMYTNTCIYTTVLAHLVLYQ